MNGLSRLATYFDTSIALPNLQSVAARLTIGGAVCLTEGLSASINAMLPKDHWYYLGSLLLAVATWLAFARFRNTKLGADTWDLCCWDMLFFAAATICYFAKIDPAAYLYTSNVISVMKLIRVYVWQGAAARLCTWPVFGFGTYFYQKHCPPDEPAADAQQPPYGLPLALLVAVLGSVFIQTLPEWQRVAATWIVPFGFEFLYGPRLLDAIKHLTTKLGNSTRRELELEADLVALREGLAHCEAENRELRQRLQAPKTEHLTLLQAYDAVTHERQAAVITMVRDMADLFPNRSGKPE
jgi:hypothetical protein